MDTIRTMAGRSFACIISSGTHFLQHVLSHIGGFRRKKRHVKRKDASVYLPHNPFPNQNPDAQNNWREVVDTKEFADQYMKLGNPPRVDEALRGISYTLASCPEHYPIESGNPGIRIAETPYVEWAGDISKLLCIRYTVEPDGTVFLLTIDQLEDL